VAEDGEVAVLVGDLVEVLVADFEVGDLVEGERVEDGNIKNNKSILFSLGKTEIVREII